MSEPSPLRARFPDLPPTPREVVAVTAAMGPRGHMERAPDAPPAAADLIDPREALAQAAATGRAALMRRMGEQYDREP